MKMNAHASAGGVNASADRYAKYLGRRVHENTARVAMRSAWRSSALGDKLGGREVLHERRLFRGRTTIGGTNYFRSRTHWGAGHFTSYFPYHGRRPCRHPLNRSARPNTSPLFRFCVSLPRCTGVARCVGLTSGTHSGRLSSDKRATSALRTVAQAWDRHILNLVRP
jgi:hypothetical protein